MTIAVPEHSGRLWHPDARRALDDSVEVEILRDTLPGLPRFGVSSVVDTIREVALSERPEFAIAIADSAMRRSDISEYDLLALDATLPPRARGILTRCDRRADSGTESILRTLLQDAGLEPHLQVRVPFTDLDRLDLTVGDRLVLECDSEAFHGTPTQRLRDLRRDTALATLGFIVLRFDYKQVLFEPDDVLAAVLSYVRLGLHES